MKVLHKAVISFALILMVLSINVVDSMALELSKDDSIILKVNIGDGYGEIGYDFSYISGGDGPEAFFVDNNRNIFIVDNVNKRVNVYSEGKCIDVIDTPYISYVRDIVVSSDSIALLDYDMGAIHKLNTDGELIKSILLPNNMEKASMRRLCLQNDNVCLIYEEKEDEFTRGHDICYPINEFESSSHKYVNGLSKDGCTSYNIASRTADSAIITMSQGGVEQTLFYVENISEETILSDIRVLNIDQLQNIYIDVFETIDSSIVIGEYTVKKYSNGICTGIAKIALDDYYFMPNDTIRISEAGELYQLKCKENEVEIVKKSFVEPASFVSSIDELLTLSKLQSNEQPRAITINAPNSYPVTMQNAKDCCDLTWIYQSSNAVNPDSSNITIPSYLAGVSKPSNQVGIPYCWGGFDGLTTSSSSSWTNFTSAMSNNKFAGNVKTSTSGYQWGTAGLDCSGFISTTAGFTTKLSSTNLASTTYTYSVSPSSRSIYDIYVKSGTHVLYYVGTSTGGIYSREATKTGDEKTKLYTRSNTWLSGYSLRRFNGW